MTKPTIDRHEFYERIVKEFDHCDQLKRMREASHNFDNWLSTDTGRVQMQRVCDTMQTDGRIHLLPKEVESIEKLDDVIRLNPSIMEWMKSGDGKHWPRNITRIRLPGYNESEFACVITNEDIIKLIDKQTMYFEHISVKNLAYLYLLEKGDVHSDDRMIPWGNIQEYLEYSEKNIPEMQHILDFEEPQFDWLRLTQLRSYAELYDAEYDCPNILDNWKFYKIYSSICKGLCKSMQMPGNSVVQRELQKFKKDISDRLSVYSNELEDTGDMTEYQQNIHKYMEDTRDIAGILNVLTGMSLAQLALISV